MWTFPWKGQNTVFIVSDFILFYSIRLGERMNDYVHCNTVEPLRLRKILTWGCVKIKYKIATVVTKTLHSLYN